MPAARVSFCLLAASLLLVLGSSCGGRSFIDEEPEAMDIPASGAAGGVGGGGGRGSGAGGGGGTDADPPSTGAGGTGGSGGSEVSSTGGTGASSTGGASGATGGTGGTGGSGTLDPNCYTPNAHNGEACTMPCTVPCGFGDLGTRECDCVAGKYAGCSCPRPLSYQGAPTAPYCAVGDGSIQYLKNIPCTTEWEECIGTDAVSGEIPRGCVCMQNRLNDDQLTWFCGSTNRWFRPE